MQLSSFGALQWTRWKASGDPGPHVSHPCLCTRRCWPLLRAHFLTKVRSSAFKHLRSHIGLLTHTHTHTHTHAHTHTRPRGPASSCPEVRVSVLSSSGQVLRGQLRPLCGSLKLPPTVPTVCGKRDGQVCLLPPRTVLRLLRGFQVSGAPFSSSL